MLEKEHSIPAATIEKSLTIIQGSVTELGAVKETLAPKGIPVRLIITGVGASPKYSGDILHPVTMDQHNICADTSSTMLVALRELRREGVVTESTRPTICVIYTTGISEMRDIP
jgi:hypothetical protein